MSFGAAQKFPGEFLELGKGWFTGVERDLDPQTEICVAREDSQAPLVEIPHLSLKQGVEEYFSNPVRGPFVLLLVSDKMQIPLCRASGIGGTCPSQVDRKRRLEGRTPLSRW
jgi:hypothetical protein